MTRFAIVALACAPLLHAGCSSCSGGDPVPFGLDTGVRAPEPREEGEPPPHADLPAARAFPDGTTRVDVEGAPILLEGAIRSLWAHDVDGDGDRDALIVSSGPAEAPVQLWVATRDGATFAPPRNLGRAPAAPEGCIIAGANLQPIGAEWIVASADLRCEAQPAASRMEHWIVAHRDAPRVLEHLAVLAAEERAPGAMSLRWALADRDDDGHDDLVVTARLERDGQSHEVELPWLDRPSGLARDADEPEATLVERSRVALRQLRGNPARAVAESQGVLALHEALCREPGRARLRIGRGAGLSCGPSDAAGRAVTNVVRGSAARGQLLGALDALAAMETPGYLIDDERRQYARRAIGEAPAAGGVTVREGPRHQPASGEAAHLSTLGFVDEDHVFLRGSSPRIWNLATGAEEPLEVQRADQRILDPSKRFAIAGVERRCEGFVLRVVPAGSVVAGRALGPTHGTPLLEPREPPAGECQEEGAALSPAHRRDDGGWRVLGWAPQAVVAARGAELRVAPLTISAEPAGAPESLGPGTPPPAPLPPGAITSDGRYLVELRGLGVLLHRTGGRGAPTLLWPEGWAEREGAPSDPAVSPSGRRIAVLRGGRVLLLERESGATP